MVPEGGRSSPVGQTIRAPAGSAKGALRARRCLSSFVRVLAESVPAGPFYADLTGRSIQSAPCRVGVVQLEVVDDVAGHPRAPSVTATTARTLIGCDEVRLVASGRTSSSPLTGYRRAPGPRLPSGLLAGPPAFTSSASPAP